MIAVRERCPICPEGSGYIAQWFYYRDNWGRRTAWFTERRCPFCRVHEGERLAWLLASMRLPGSALRVTR